MKKLALVILMVLMSFGIAKAEVRVSVLSPGVDVVSDAGIVKVKLAFDTEYKINLDNKDTRRRALVKIRIDGRNVTSDGLILREGENVGLERFLDSGTLTKGSRFKFIPKEADSLRPDNPEDGQIIVTVQYEKTSMPLVDYKIPVYTLIWNQDNLTVTDRYFSATINTNTTTDEPGITVEGSESVQRFQKDDVREMEERIDTLVIQLVGYYKDKPILLKKGEKK